ncbi:MAG: DUF1800 domain-containing protein, partial [Planctomycetes bacterium]|nr:DUF1800 domain-containing protein [Planctomycetota bacterium]
MHTSERPLEEKLALFWHGHFATSAQKVKSSWHTHQLNDVFRKHAAGNFKQLTIEVGQSPSMLRYLDNNKSTKKHPNENWARELMELFTLGVGAYTENDIKEAARAFTGWQMDEDGFVFRGRNHDYGEKKFLGRTGKLNGEDIVDTILAQAACSRFMARNLIEFFVRPDPPKPLVEALAAELRKQKWELRPAMKTLFKSQAFFDPASRGCLVKSPVELVVGSSRRLGIPIANLVAAERATASMGQEIMQPPNVKGWDGEEKWINTATLFQRYNTIGLMLTGGGDGPQRGRMARRLSKGAGTESDESSDEKAGDEMMTMMGSAKTPKSRMNLEPQPAYDPLATVRAHDLKSAAEIVRFYERILLPKELS